MINRYKHWSYEAKQYLAKNFLQSSKKLAKKLGRTESSIQAKKQAMGLRKYTPVSEEDVELIKRWAGTYNTKKIALYLDKTVDQIRQAAYKHNISLRVPLVSDAEKMKMWEMRNQGLTYMEINDAFPHISISTIHNYVNQVDTNTLH